MAWHLEKRFDLYDGCEILSKKKNNFKKKYEKHFLALS
jgi:hypothetical protein